MTSHLRNSLRGVTLAAAAMLVTLQTVSSDARGASPPTRLRVAAKAAIQPIVTGVAAFGVSRPLSELPKAQPPGDPQGIVSEEDEFLIHPTGDGSYRGPDPALQQGGGGSGIPPTSRNFDGINIGGSSSDGVFVGAPPDTNGDVGPSHYVQIVNTTFAVYSKNGALLAGPTPINNLWKSAPNAAEFNCTTYSRGDPIVQYDPLANRWLISQFNFPLVPVPNVTALILPPFDQCIAISKTADPTGAYFLYDFHYSDTLFNDYPHFGVWPDAYYMSVNQFEVVAGLVVGFHSGGACAFEREKMLAGDPSARQVCFDESAFDPGDGSGGFLYGGQLPSDLDGTGIGASFASPPPAGSPNYFIQFVDSTTAGQDKLLLFKFHVDWADPASSWFGTGPGSGHGKPIEIPVADFNSNLCNFARNCVPQKDSADSLDSISDRLMYRLAYRNFGDHESLLMNHSVNVGDTPNHSGVRWYEVRNPGGAPVVHQQSTWAPDTEHRWMGSIAMDQAGDIALGYSLSSNSRNPAIAYTGRRAGDPLGQMTLGEGLLYQGLGAQVGTGNRWGDYSSMSVDPNGCAFWYTTEYYPGTGTFNWATRIGAFTLPTCGDPQLSLNASASSLRIGGDITYTIGVTTGQNPVLGATVTDLLPSGVTLLSVTPSTGSCQGTGTVVCNLGDLPAGDLETITVTVRANTAGTLTNTATLSTTSPDSDASNNSASVQTVVYTPCALPGFTRLSDPTGDALDQNPAHDVQSVSIAEPDLGPGVNKLVFTLKVASLSSVPPDTTWPVTFTFNGAPWFVAMKTSPLGVVSFRYGTGNGSTNGVGDLDAGSGFTPDGTITLVISNSKITGGTPADSPSAGELLRGFLTRVRVESQAGPALTPDNAPNSAAPDGDYELSGNAFCAYTPPVARDDSASTSPDASVTINVLANDSDADGDALTVTSAGPAARGSVLNNHDGTVTYTPNAGSAGTDSFGYTISDGRGGSASANVTVTVTATPQPALTFGHDTIADFSATGGEPFVRVGPKGTPVQDQIFVSVPFGFSTTVSLMWKSIDDGKSFIPLGTPIVRDAVTGPGGGDTHQDFDARGRLYYADLSAACVTAAVSEDGGNTFPPDRTNFLTCIGGGDDPQGAQDDRQWVGAFGDGLGYVTVRNLAVSTGGGNFHFFRTRDAGRTWDGQILGTVGQSGPLQVDKKKRKVVVGGVERDAILLYQIHTGLNMFRITDLDDGSMPTAVNRSVVSSGNILFPVSSIDTSGNLYVVWSTGPNIFMRTSQDRGDTWSATIQVSPPSLAGTNIMPWIVAGDPGRVGIVWYRTAGANNASAVWDIYMAQSLNALSASPSLTVAKVNETVIHRGEICTAGLNCDIATVTGTPRDRSFLEFPSIDIDSRGAAVITFNDNTNQADGAGKPGGAYVMVTRQTGGPSLYQSVGSLGLDPGSVTITRPTEGEVLPSSSVTAAGTHTLPADNVSEDKVGDAKFPDHGPVIGPSIPALDIRKVSVADDASSVTVTMELGDLTLAALATAAGQSGGDGVLYLTQWDFNDRVYWVAAEVRAGQPVFYTGTLGVIKSATSKKFITYNPDLVLSQQVTGAITNAAPGLITIRIPRSLVGSPADGSSLFTLTGYTMSERGPLVPVGDLQGQPDPSSLPIQVDAAAPFTYVVGNGSPVDGVVQVSLDDASFSNPSLASASADGTWSLPVSGLAVGAHAAYARQHINGREASAAALVHFSVNAPPVAANDSYVTVQDTALNVPVPGVLGNDSDPNGNTLTAVQVSGPANGTLTLNANGSFIYTPAASYSGPDSFTYKANDGLADSNVATVSITINPAAEPDLRVTNITATNAKPKEGDRVTITATVSNTGTLLAAASKTQFLLDGTTVLGLVDTSSIAAGGSTSVSVPWDTRGVKGEHTIRVIADQTGLVAESNESNNTGVFTVTVQGNRVKNGSFEEGSASASAMQAASSQESTNGPAYWSGSSTEAGTATWSDGGSDGSKSAATTGNGGNAATSGSPSWTSDPIAVTPGEVLTFAVSVQSLDASSAASAGLVYLGAAGDVLSTVNLITAPLTTTGFAKLEQAVTIPAGVAQVRVQLVGFAPTDLRTAGTVSFDEVGLFGN